LWGTDCCKRAIDLLYERNCRIEAGIYRDSISLALAAIALPFAAAELGYARGKVWKHRDELVDEMLYKWVGKIFTPQTLMVKVREAAVKIMLMQSLLEQAAPQDVPGLMRHKSYAHGRELMLIRHLALGEDVKALEEKFPAGCDPREFHLYTPPRPKKRHPDKKYRSKPFRKRGKKPETPPDFSE
jgi:poly(A) polymerase